MDLYVVSINGGTSKCLVHILQNPKMELILENLNIWKKKDDLVCTPMT